MRFHILVDEFTKRNRQLVMPPLQRLKLFTPITVQEGHPKLFSALLKFTWIEFEIYSRGLADYKYATEIS
jgi:hypothetical protein